MLLFAAMVETAGKHAICLFIIKGDATNDDVLLQAGIKRAKALLSVLPDVFKVFSYFAIYYVLS